MWVVYSLLAVLGVLAAVLFVPLYVRIAYDGDLKATVRVLGIPVTLLPAEKTDIKPRKNKKKKPAKADKPSQTAEWKQLLMQDGVSGAVTFLRRLARLAGKAVERLRKGIVVDRLRFELCVATEDAADTAVRYGQVCGAIYPAVAALEQAVRVRKRHLRIEPNFLTERSEARFDVRWHVTVFCLLRAGIPLVVGLMQELFSQQDTTDTKEDV